MLALACVFVRVLTPTLCSGLSGEANKRVGIATEIVSMPPVLFLDECVLSRLLNNLELRIVSHVLTYVMTHTGPPLAWTLLAR